MLLKLLLQISIFSLPIRIRTMKVIPSYLNQNLNSRKIKKIIQFSKLEGLE